MKRFILSAFSVLVATGAIAPTAQALPQVSSDFDLQTLRLSEFDTRNKSEVKSTSKLQMLRLHELDIRNKSGDGQQPYYPYKPHMQKPAQTNAWPLSIDTSIEPGNPIDVDLTTVEDVEGAIATDFHSLSLAEQRHQFLDRS
ncbi:hypothetical protein [cf. Phormidesmis sp. LEGE 11477]|uniref:hypothetical protein n=1 Tax=cf. Phormidesmis sp. LEGE 11477 TaxID=1828680 RepID=UPI00187F5BDD|nr:hypothetical protein [cf. Phormidesmis sp. LEGE 11477]MBE9060503.1 hypothetical protein [cf. Phormidesmis sp. LEGE 11477]